MSNSDLRLIEDYLPIEAISAEASREKSVRKGHISTLHLWWARRPLVACRAAVYGALVQADRWVDAEKISTKNAPGNGAAKVERWKNGSAKGLNRKAAKDFVKRLCRYPGDPQVIQQAQRHILEAHAEHLSVELTDATVKGQAPGWVAEFKFTGECVSYEDIIAGRAPRPRALDMSPLWTGFRSPMMIPQALPAESYGEAQVHEGNNAPQTGIQVREDAVVSSSQIEALILSIRGRRVVLDSDGFDIANCDIKETGRATKAPGCFYGTRRDEAIRSLVQTIRQLMAAPERGRRSIGPVVSPVERFRVEERGVVYRRRRRKHITKA